MLPIGLPGGKVAMQDGTDQLNETASPAVTRPQAVLCVVLRREQPRRPGSRHLLTDVRRVTLRRGSEGVLRLADELIIEVDDRAVSSPHLELTRRGGDWLIHDLGARNGTRIEGEPLPPGQRRTLRDGDLIELGCTFLIFRLDQPTQADDPLDLLGEAKTAFPGWQTFHLPLAHLYREAALLAPTRLNALLLGPTGVGKQRVAEGIHALSDRKLPMISVNCATLSEATADSELFGHRRGAFTGALGDRIGLLRTAAGSTLFLDEVADLPPAVQTRLLKVIEDGRVRPLGGDLPADPIDVRIIAATSRPLERLLPDLRFRLEGFTLRVPALSDRREDFGLMVAEAVKGQPLLLEADCARALMLHDWSGGARQLRNTVERLAAFAAHRPEHRVHAADLPFTPPEAPRPDPTRATIEAALRAAAGHVGQAAAQLGFSQSHLYRLINAHGIDRATFR